VKVELPPQLASLAGRRISRIRRIFYVFRDEVESRFGPVEVAFSEGAFVWFDSGADGYTLKIQFAEWVDIFAEPLSDENREYVAKSGKPMAFDVSDQPPYRDLVGQSVVDVRPQSDSPGKLTGVSFVTESHVLHAVVGPDELIVQVQ
jgi:hypothetical protein